MAAQRCQLTRPVSAWLVLGITIMVAGIQVAGAGIVTRRQVVTRSGVMARHEFRARYAFDPARRPLDLAHEASIV